MTDTNGRILREFIVACGRYPGKVVPIYDVLTDARNHYRLKSKKELFDFIANKGLEHTVFQNKSEWKKNYTEVKPLYVYAWTFKTNHIPGYIAIIKNDAMDNWLLKSFHPPAGKLTLADKFAEAKRLEK